jgi:hypothetical protein
MRSHPRCPRHRRSQRMEKSHNGYFLRSIGGVELRPGGEGESLFVNVIACDDTAKTALLALDDGDSVALTGALTPKVWADKNGEARPALDMVAHCVLTAYHVRRKRKAIQPGDRRGNEPVQGDGFEVGI